MRGDRGPIPNWKMITWIEKMGPNLGRIIGDFRRVFGGLIPKRRDS